MRPIYGVPNRPLSRSGVTQASRPFQPEAIPPAEMSGTAGGVGGYLGGTFPSPTLFPSNNLFPGDATLVTPIVVFFTGTTGGTGATGGEGIHIPPQPAWMVGTASGVGALPGRLLPSGALLPSPGLLPSQWPLLTAVPQLSGSISGTGTTFGEVTGGTGVPSQITGTVAATGTTTGALTAVPQLAGDVMGEATLTGLLSAEVSLEGSMEGEAVGDVTGILTTVGDPVISLNPTSLSFTATV